MKQRWTQNDIPDLTGKVIIVTGGNSGLGYEAVRLFTEHGAEVILASRSIENGNYAKARIMQHSPSGSINVMQLDLADLGSVQRFCTSFTSIYSKLNVLLNNAGIMTTPYHLTQDGFEGQLGTNHLGHFALTGLLWDLLSRTQDSRIVNVSSLAHRSGTMDFNNLQFDGDKGYTPMGAYGRSKLANLLFTYELQRRIEKAGISSLAVAAHPGVSNTELFRHYKHKLFYKLLKPLIGKVIQDPAQGALPEVRAAVGSEVAGSSYYGPSGRGELKGFPVIVNSNEASHNLEDAKRLWKLSEELTGVSFLSGPF